MSKMWLVGLLAVSLSGVALAGPEVPRSVDLPADKEAEASDMQAKLEALRADLSRARGAEVSAKGLTKTTKAKMKANKAREKADKAAIKASRKENDQPKVTAARAALDATQRAGADLARAYSVAGIDARLASAQVEYIEAELVWQAASLEAFKAHSATGVELDLAKFDVAVSKAEVQVQRARQTLEELRGQRAAMQ